jgi:hypothetical protein
MDDPGEKAMQILPAGLPGGWIVLQSIGWWLLRVMGIEASVSPANSSSGNQVPRWA